MFETYERVSDQTDGKSFKRDQYSTLSLSLFRLIMHSRRNNPVQRWSNTGLISIDRYDDDSIVSETMNLYHILQTCGGFKHEGGCRIVSRI